MLKIGSKAQVFHGTAERTSGGLAKIDLVKTAQGRIVSRKMSCRVPSAWITASAEVMAGRPFEPVKKGTDAYKQIKKRAAEIEKVRERKASKIKPCRK